MKNVIRKPINEETFNSLIPFNKMAHKAEEITGLSKENYWFQVTMELTVDNNTNSFAVIESHPRGTIK